jgi:hypothetical protein
LFVHRRLEKLAMRQIGNQTELIATLRGMRGMDMGNPADREGDEHLMERLWTKRSHDSEWESFTKKILAVNAERATFEIDFATMADMGFTPLSGQPSN